ncbi:MAG: cation:proton antiporter [Candidatus Pacearchaeota archaeon]|jgi:Kef-type K+ transport system membrane component KefB/Trk K+ transport system NAD-binding subunit
MVSIFIQLSIILLVAFIVSYIVRLLNQPIIIGYIIAGIILSPFLINLGASTDMIDSFSQFGIAFLLFIVGLHLNPKVIKDIGVASLVVGLGQIIFIFGITFAIAFKLLNFDLISSLFIGIAISFSSTIIVMKILSDKSQLDSLFGKISIGILIIQDLVAIAVLIFMSSITKGKQVFTPGIEGILIGAGLVILLFLIGYFLLPRITKTVAKSQELLFLFSICWCFIIAAIFSYLGFSMEIGALIAGVILSVSPYSAEISSKIRPLRDFFLIIFFIILGLKIQFANFGKIIVNALIFSGIALILKPIILMFFMKFFKYTKRTNFLTGIALGQISEFSIIILALGVSLNYVLPETLNTIILTLIITILLSTYLIIYSEKIYQKTSRFFSVFESKKIREERKEHHLKKNYEAILFGYNRIGFNILNSLKKINKDYLVVDFNPDIIKDLNQLKIPALYGDVFDLELLEDLHLDKVKLAVSTIPDLETNMLLIEFVRSVNPEAIVILRAHSIEEAMQLYNQGASYVLTPHFLGGEYVAKMIAHSRTDKRYYEEEKKKHIKMLTGIKEKGHKHPEVEKN